MRSAHAEIDRTRIAERRVNASGPRGRCRIPARVKGMVEGQMTITLRSQAGDADPPPPIDLGSFRRVTAALTRCSMEAAAAVNEPIGNGERHQRLAAAIYANMELWGTVLHAVLDPAHKLPQDLQAHLVEIAEVSIRHGSLVLQGEAAVDPLLAINRSIIDGLQRPKPMLAERTRPMLAAVGEL
jgi:flagellar protein FlaF